MTKGFGELFDGLDDLLGQGKKPESKPEKGVPLRGKKIDGVQYVRLEDVVELLRVNDVLPGLQKSLGRKT